jgi:hypothetical protein
MSLTDENLTFEYKGYNGTLNYSTHFNSYWGRVLVEDNESLVYDGKSREDAFSEFKKVVDNYLILEN